MTAQQEKRIEVSAVNAAYDESKIARGLKLTVENPGLAAKFVNGTITANDLVRALMDNGTGVGVWWGIMERFGDLSDFEDYAWGEESESLKTAWEEYHQPENSHYGWIGGEVQVVLIAERPVANGKPWDPDDNPLEMGGLMGNSYLPNGQQINLVEIRFDAGWGWKSMNARGIRTTASVAYYHVSGRSNRASIEQHGLQGGDHGVWLYSDPERVRGIGKVWAPGHPFEEQDVWLVEPVDVVQGAQARDQWSADEHYPTDPVWVTYTDVPPERVHRVDNHTLQATALPSWRDRGARPEAEAVIVPDLGRARGNSYEVFLYGQPHGHRPSLAEAKALVEEIYGEQEWVKVPGDTDPHNDPVWGQTTLFNDAPYYLMVQRLPRLGTTAVAGDTFEIHEVDISAVSTARCLALYVSEEFPSPMGLITWDRSTGNVEMVYVDSEFRGQGLATQLLEHAKEMQGGPLSAHGEFTEEGEAWSRRKGLSPNVEHRLEANEFRAMAGRLLVHIGRLPHTIRRLASAGTFYRLHHKNKPWSLTPTSREFTQNSYDNVRRRVGEEQEGYSCFANPWHLFDYVVRRRWHYTDDEVVTFSGHEVGRGVDNEPLAVPESQPTRKMGWEEFADWVIEQPMGSPPEWKGGQYGVVWGDPDHYVNETVKTYDKPMWERLSGVQEVVVGQTRAMGDMPAVWFVRSKADSKILRGGLPDEEAAREFASEHGMTVVAAGSRGSLPPRLRMRHDTLDGGGGRIVAFDDDSDHPHSKQFGIGMLSWNSEGQVSWVQTYDEEYQRRGIATAMWNAALEDEPNLHHSRELNDTSRPWSKTTPDRTRVAVAKPAVAVMSEDHWRPTKGMFARGSDTLDPRIFDTDTERMLPNIRTSVIFYLDMYWTGKYGYNWRDWAKVYLAGSGASYWWDSDADFDVLIGVDLARLREIRPANKEVSDVEVLAALNHGLQTDLRPLTKNLNGFETTWFVNAGAYDIRAIHPYAAYDMTASEWVVKPPVLPANWGPDSIPASTWSRCEQAALNAKEMLSLPEPERTIAGTVYFNWVHEGRRAAYSAYGGGWLDPGNVIYQYLTQHPEGLLRRLYLCKHPEAATEAESLKATASGVTYEYVPDRGTEGRAISGPGAMIVAKVDGQEIGGLAWYTKFIAGPMGHQAGQIEGVYVLEAHQRQGIATEMWRRAREIEPRLHHSHALTEDGRAWSQVTASVPGLVIEEEWELPAMRPGGGERAVTARVDGKLVGGLIWEVADGIINYVQVDLDMRRKGIASALLEAARALDPNVRHDVETNRSETGKEWVRAVGARSVDMTPETPKDWKGNGLYEVDLTGVSRHGCVAIYAMAMGMPWPIGWLTWDKSTHTVEGVWVMDDHRGQGFGADLLERAEQVAGTKLVDSGEYTPEGFEWAKKRGLNPTMDKKTPASEMGRMIAQMNEILIGGQRIKRQLEAYGSRRTARISPMPFAGYDGPLKRRFNSYDDQSQRDIQRAVRAFEEGTLGEAPDPKKGPLAGLYTIPVGARSESSTSERLLMMPSSHGWYAVYYLPFHNYDQAERDIAGWQRAMERQQGKQANLAFYSREWRWQAWAKRNGFASLIERTTLPQLRKAAQAVLDDYGVTAPLAISMGAAGIGYSEGGLQNGQAYVLINPDEKNLWNALHEVSHVVCDHMGMDSFDSDHGPGFRRIFTEVLQVHGGIDIEDIGENPPQRVASSSLTLLGQG